MPRRSRSWLVFTFALAVLAHPAGAEEHLDQASVRPKDPAGAEVGFGPTTGLVFDSPEAHLELHGYGWLRVQTDSRVGGETDAEASVPVGRVFAVGSVLNSRLHFFAQPEFAGSRVELLDLFAEWRFGPSLHIRGGQFRVPYSRAFITPLTNLELPTRGLVIDQFGLGRDTGVMASGLLADNRVHYDVAIVNGATINDRQGDRDAPAVIARTELRLGNPVPYDQAPSLSIDDPHGLTIGVGGAFSRRSIRGATGTSSEQLWNASADLAWMKGPVSVRMEGFLRSAHGSPRVAHAIGVYSQLGVFVIPKRLEVGGRAGWLTDGPDVQTYEAFLTTYWKAGSLFLGHHLKTIFAYRFDSRDATGPDARDRHIAQIQTQLFF